MRVLLSAYQCGPGMGSVSQIGWEWYSRMSKLAQVTLITHVRNRVCLTKAGAPLPGTEVIYIDTEWFAGPVYRLAARLFPRSEHAVFLLSSADFFVYDGSALRQLRRRRADWDIVHAVTPVSPIASSRLHRLGLPLVVGPWNGGLNSPTTFPEIMGQDSAWVYRIRSVGRLFDRLFGCSRHAAVVLSANKATDQSLPAHAKLLRMTENGVDLNVFRPAVRPLRTESDPLKILFVGRLIPAKGVSMLLEAIALLRHEFSLSLSIVGDGPVRADLERETTERSLTDIVRFAGNRPLAEVAQRMSEADVFCLPCVRESGGAVLLESLACAVPILAVKYGGPAEIVDDQVGCPLSPEGHVPLVRDLTEALRDLHRNPEAWRSRGERGRQVVVENYGWDARMNTAFAIYERLAKGQTAHA